MKALKLFVSLALLAFGASVFAQSAIIDENFQSFKEQGWKNDTLCNFKKTDSKAAFKVSKDYSGNKVEYSFKKCGVTPTCETKKTPSKAGVTAGYVEINKKEGELVISEQKFISTIEVGASAAGDGRGFTIYKSVKGGDWVKIGEYFGKKSEGSDAQYGFVSSIPVNESNVSIKFGPAASANKEGEVEMQTIRIHNIKVMGK